MPLNYGLWQTQFLNAVAGSTTDPNWAIQLPNAIDYAEQRIYRELDPNGVRVTDYTGNLTALSQYFTLPTGLGTFVTVESVFVVTPSSIAFGSSIAVVTPLVPVGMDFIETVYPYQGSSGAGVPEFWAPYSGPYGLMSASGMLQVGPLSDQAYNTGVRGIIRPTPLSVSNSSTILTQLVPDLFYAGTMISAAGYMRDFGQQSDNPQMAQSWENQFELLLKSALVEEAKKMMRSQGWTAYQPSPIATPARV